MPPRKKTEFQVHGLAAAKKPRAKKPKPEDGPVKVTRIRPETLAHAKEIADGRDVHLVYMPDGSIEIRNGKRE